MATLCNATTLTAAERRDAAPQTPGITFENQTGDVAIDHYHRYKEDVALMKQLGIKHYRYAGAGQLGVRLWAGSLATRTCRCQCACTGPRAAASASKLS